MMVKLTMVKLKLRNARGKPRQTITEKAKMRPFWFSCIRIVVGQGREPVANALEDSEVPLRRTRPFGGTQFGSGVGAFLGYL